ncbi:MAG TPA: 2Fe-2S iron-sulfur cluster-binding protein, partial [Caldilineaceae bacterium]|nr:2Fe-2S iron-sulfur cluster-binding protein [Caldilineaceae bacterium]
MGAVSNPQANGQAEGDAPLTLTLDGEPVSFGLGETLYEIARRYGKQIPTLCYDPRLAPFGACRLCIVEVRGARAPVAACTTQAVMGMA